VQADHAEYADWRADECPGVQLVFDGRGVMEETNWPDSVKFLKIGVPDPID
jgi:hypothetical protein